MARKTRRLVRSALALAAASVAELALQKIAQDPRVKRKAKAVAKSARKKLKSSGKKLAGLVKPGPKKNPKKNPKKKPKRARATASRKKAAEKNG